MKSSSRHIAPVVFSALALTLSLSAIAAPPPAQPGLTTDKDKISYAVGMKFGNDINNAMESVKGELDVATVLRGVTNTVSGKTLMTVPEAQATLQAFGKKMQEKQTAQAAATGQKNLADGKAFLAANGKKPGVKTTASGIEYQVLETGTGPKPKATDSVKVDYKGELLDGTVFDSSDQHGGSAVMALNGVIPGWTEGVQLMNVGSKFVFWIPGNLAYGSQAGGPGGPNAMLKFEIKLVSIGNK